MSLDNAQEFVGAMRQEQTFRQAAVKAASDRKMAAFLQSHNYTFDLDDLVIAMAGCMDEMARPCPQSP